MNALAAIAFGLALVCGIYSGYRAGWLRGERAGWLEGVDEGIRREKRARERESQWEAAGREYRKAMAGDP